jgi:iron-sulfur cluster repair protein YtfE (RIC family)
LFCWKIRAGFTRNIPASRMKAYADWFFHTHLLPHFEMEEQHIFPLLGSENLLVKKALAEHRRLTRLFENAEKPEKILGQIEEELDAHIRFEERILFNEIQKQVAGETLNEIEALHSLEAAEIACWADEFWETK